MICVLHGRHTIQLSRQSSGRELEDTLFTAHYTREFYKKKNESI